MRVYYGCECAMSNHVITFSSSDEGVIYVEIPILPTTKWNAVKYLTRYMFGSKTKDSCWCGVGLDKKMKAALLKQINDFLGEFDTIDLSSDDLGQSDQLGPKGPGKGDPLILTWGSSFISDSKEHLLRVYTESFIPTSVSFDVAANPDLSFRKRLWYVVKYFLGQKGRFGDWSPFTLGIDDVKALKNFIDTVMT